MGVALAALVIVLDQLSEVVDRGRRDESRSRILEITPFFNIVLVRNRGASFGLLGGRGRLGALGPDRARARDREPGSRSGSARTGTLGCGGARHDVGGAAGNVIDRLRFGAVVDFLDFHWATTIGLPLIWPNSAITVGVAILLADALIGRDGQDLICECDEARRAMRFLGVAAWCWPPCACRGLRVGARNLRLHQDRRPTSSRW